MRVLLLAAIVAIPEPYGQVAFERDGFEIARFHYGPGIERPFVYPVIGPSGKRLTRMGHPGDPFTHSHHNSIWVSMASVNGVDFWSDHGANPLGRIVTTRVEQIGESDDRASVVSMAAWTAPGGKVLLDERRFTIVKLLPNREWLLIIDLEWSPRAGPVVLADGSSQFGPIGVRLAKTMSVYHGGGRIRNSEGAEGEAAVFRKPARWVDYSGPAAPGIIEGLTLMDHPSNPRHPGAFHVREDGWMGAMFTHQGPVTVQPGAKLRLRYGVYVHSGAPARETLDASWREFVDTPLRSPFGPPADERACLHGDFRRFTVPREFLSQADCAAAAKQRR